MIEDHALEANRRLAWARYYAVRSDLETVTLWAAELGAYASAILGELPPQMAELIDLIDKALDDVDRRIIRRTVRLRLAAAA